MCRCLRFGYGKYVILQNYLTIAKELSELCYCFLRGANLQNVAEFCLPVVLVMNCLRLASGLKFFKDQFVVKSRTGLQVDCRGTRRKVWLLGGASLGEIVRLAQQRMLGFLFSFKIAI